MTKKPSLLDNVPSIEERMRMELSEGKADLRRSSKRTAILALIIAISVVATALRSGAWGFRFLIGMLLAVVMAFVAYRSWKVGNEPDV